ncbi:MAG: spondin domain-containing protein, partial [Acidimicrobiales bacterium]
MTSGDFIRDSYSPGGPRWVAKSSTHLERPLMLRRFALLLAALSLVALLAPSGAAASESDHGRSESDHHESDSDDDEESDDDRVRTYEVTITNLTEGQPFTPPLVAVTDKRVRLFKVGRAASPEIREIAENGNLAPML